MRLRSMQLPIFRPSMRRRPDCAGSSCFILAACVISAGIVGNTLTRAQESSESTFSTDTRLVVLHATVVDTKGRFVTNLPRPSVYSARRQCRPADQAVSAGGKFQCRLQLLSTTAA